MEGIEQFLLNYWDKIPLLISFLGGIVTFLAPCTFPLLPIFLSYIGGVGAIDAGKDIEKNIRMKIFVNTLFFVFGFSAVYIGLGILASYFGNILQTIINNVYFYKILGLVVILMGLHMTGIFKIKLLAMDKKFNLKIKTGRYLTSFLLGLAFAFGWSACTGPILGTILLMAASSNSVVQGVSYSIAFSLGLALPFIIFAFFIEKLIKTISKMKKYLHIVEIIGGIVIIAMGVLLFFNKLTYLAQILN